MPTGLKEKKYEGRLSDDEKAALDGRTFVSSADTEAVYADPGRFEHWRCRYLEARYVILHARRVQGDVVGESYLKPPLIAQFKDGHLFLDREDPQFNLISGYLHRHSDMKDRTLFCVSDIQDEAEKKEMATTRHVGKSDKVKLQAIGVYGEDHANVLRRALKMRENLETAKVKQENKELADRLAAAEARLAAATGAGRKPKERSDE
jgi:hypothetical protein